MDKKPVEHVRRVAEKAIEIYNRYRSPEAIAELVDFKENGEEAVVAVRFSGSFCSTCGVRDWVEDYAYTLEELGYHAELVKYIEPEHGDNYRIGVFKIRIKGQENHSGDNQDARPT
ncbi:hypothetical protein J4526_07735 [Desulfurococcaceae archaeon MEX13E-LK6-19]|nr:hypothetical protein J4526_07735 [Desulfurococcaceae archaeon MEX13E-LK6-19]